MPNRPAGETPAGRRALLGESLPPDRQISELLRKHRRWGSQLEASLARFSTLLNPRCVARVILSSSSCSSPPSPPSVDLALHFFFWCGRQEGFLHDARTCSILFHLLAKAHRLQTVSRIADVMRKQGLQFTQELYGTLIRVYKSGGLWRKALAVYAEMKESNLQPQIRVSESLLHWFFRRSRFREAHEILRSMVRTGLYRNSTCFSVVSNLCKRSEVIQALRVLDVLEEEGFVPSGMVYNTLMTALCRANRIDEACSLFNHMVGKGLSPNEYDYTVILNALVRRRKLEFLIPVFHNMVHTGCTPNIVTYTNLLDGLFKQGNVEEAINLFNRLPQMGCYPDIVTYNVMLQGFVKSGRSNAAVYLFRNLRRKGFPPNVASYNVMIAFYFDHGGVDEALTIFQEMVNQGCTDTRSAPDTSTYSLLLTGLLKNDRVDEGLSMLRNWTKVQSVNAGIYSSVVGHLHNIGRTDLAVKVFNEAVQIDHSASVRGLRRSFENLCKCFSHGEEP